MPDDVSKNSKIPRDSWNSLIRWYSTRLLFRAQPKKNKKNKEKKGRRGAGLLIFREGMHAYSFLPNESLSLVNRGIFTEARTAVWFANWQQADVFQNAIFYRDIHSVLLKVQFYYSFSEWFLNNLHFHQYHIAISIKDDFSLEPSAWFYWRKVQKTSNLIVIIICI